MNFLEKINKIISELEYERDWREKEFKKIKRIYLTLNNQINTLQTYKYMCMPIIYAHWEGFCVISFKIIVAYINDLEIEYHKLKNNIFTFSHSKTYDYLKGKQSFDQRCKFSNDFIKTLINKKITIPNFFNTKSNFNYSVLTEMCNLLALENNFSLYERDLNRLVAIRNNIAHGENGIEINEEELFNFIKVIMEVFDLLIITYRDYLLNEKYLKEIG
jgi:hypothetical protein